MRNHLLLFLTFLIAMPISTVAGDTSIYLSGGFRNLKWGISVKEASIIYKDLRKYNRKSKSPFDADDNMSLYDRENEDKHVGGVVFREIVYSFYHDKLYKVMMAESGNENVVINMFDVLTKYIMTKYGNPAEDNISPGEFSIRMTKWVSDGTEITTLLMFIGEKESRIGSMSLELKSTKPMGELGF